MSPYKKPEISSLYLEDGTDNSPLAAGVTLVVGPVAVAAAVVAVTVSAAGIAASYNVGVGYTLAALNEVAYAYDVVEVMVHVSNNE